MIVYIISRYYNDAINSTNTASNGAYFKIVLTNTLLFILWGSLVNNSVPTSKKTYHLSFKRPVA
jgi:hypothetical protein